MKISLSWLFDYINYDKSKVNINHLVDMLNKKVAEVENIKKVEIDVKNLFLTTVKELGDQICTLQIPELNIEVKLQLRSDIKLGGVYLLKRDESCCDGSMQSLSNFKWAQASDFGSEKEALLPSFFADDKILLGSWKKNFEHDDYILEISNTTITHRPDLWGHKGFAREVAACLGASLKPSADFLEKIDIIKTVNSFARQGNFEISVQDFGICKRLSVLQIDSIDNQDSVLDIASRIARVDSKPINAIVDITNYVMFDIGQPMHAFDADFFGNKFFIRSAKNGEKLTLLDGENIELNSFDCVVSSESKVASLAGIMGGKDSEIHVGENVDGVLKIKVILEAACFDAGVIRKTSTRLKKRTEASARYEKTLNPNNTVDAIKRFVFLANKFGLELNYDKNAILSVGEEAKPKEIIIEHDFIEKKLGIAVDSYALVAILKAEGFEVIQDVSTYKIIVPPSRSVKDLSIPEDIVEEVIRFYGYENITYDMPQIISEPKDMNNILKLRNIKNYLAYSIKMFEISAYPFYDEEFLHDLDYSPKNFVEVQNPQSQNWKRLVTSLIPHLIKAVKVNLHKANDLRFFEVAKVWSLSGVTALETKTLSGIFFSYSNSVEWIKVKAYLQGLFAELNISVEWQKSESDDLLLNVNQKSDIFIADKKIGTLGKLNPALISKISDKGEAIVFELNLDLIIAAKQKTIGYKPISKYQEVDLDVSFMAPLKLKVEDFNKIIKSASDLIVDVRLVDLFQKKEWVDKKSMTFRYILQSQTKTLNKQEIDEVSQRVSSLLAASGVEIR